MLNLSHRLTAAALLLAPALALTACGSDPVQTTPVREAAPASAGPALAIDVPILGKVSGDQLAGDDYGVKLLNVAELVGTGLGQAFASAGVELDPEAHSVVLLALGEQPSGGFAADITALQHKGGSAGGHRGPQRHQVKPEGAGPTPCDNPKADPPGGGSGL